MEGDITLGLKYVGAGLATLGMIGAAIGVGNIFGSFLDAAMRNVSLALPDAAHALKNAWPTRPSPAKGWILANCSGSRRTARVI